MFFGCHILVQNRSVSFASGCWYVFVSPHLPIVGESCFVCIVLPFVNISLISLISPELSGLFPQVVLLFFPVLPFPFCSRIFQCLPFVLSFWPVFVVFLFVFPVEFLILVLTFSSCFLRGSQYSHKLISLMYRLVYLTRSYYSLVYKVVFDLFYSFLS